MSIKSSKKRVLINRFWKKINSIKKSIFKTYFKKVSLSIKNKDKKKSLIDFCIFQSISDRLASRNILSLNKVSRYKSNLIKLINNID